MEDVSKLQSVPFRCC